MAADSSSADEFDTVVEGMRLRLKGSNLRKVDLESSEVSELLNGIKRTNADSEFRERYWKIRTIHVINNEQLNKSFRDFKNGFGDKTRRLEDYQERLVFSCETKKSIENISREGYVIGKKKRHVLGHAGSGVHLVRNYDILTRLLAVQETSQSCFVMVHKAVLGKTKPIVPRVHKEDNYVKPYIGFDCHVSARRVVPDMPISDAYKCSHVFFYEHDDVTSLPIRCPRQILPYAVLELVKKQQLHFETPFLAFGARKSQWEVKGETRRGFRFVLNKAGNEAKQKLVHRKRKSENDMKISLKEQLLEMRTRWPEPCTLPKKRKLDKQMTESISVTDKSLSQKEIIKSVKCKNRLRHVTKLHRIVRKLPLSMKPILSLKRISPNLISNYNSDDSHKECESYHEEHTKLDQFSSKTQTEDCKEKSNADNGKDDPMSETTRTCEVDGKVNDEKVILTQTDFGKNHGSKPIVSACVTLPSESGQALVAASETFVAECSNVTDKDVTERVESPDINQFERNASPVSKGNEIIYDNVHSYTNEEGQTNNGSEMSNRAHTLHSEIHRIVPNVITATSSETNLLDQNPIGKESGLNVDRDIPQVGIGQPVRTKHCSKSDRCMLRDPKHSRTMQTLVHHVQAPTCQDALNSGGGFLDTKQVIENFKALSKTNMDTLCLEAVETMPKTLNHSKNSETQHHTQNELYCETGEDGYVQNRTHAETTEAKTACYNHSVNTPDTTNVNSLGVAQLPQHMFTYTSDLSAQNPVSCEENTSFFKPFLKVMDDRAPPKAEFKSVKSIKSNNFNAPAKTLNDKSNTLLEHTIFRALSDRKSEAGGYVIPRFEASAQVNPKTSAMTENHDDANVTYFKVNPPTCTDNTANVSTASFVSQTSLSKQISQSTSNSNGDKKRNNNPSLQNTRALNKDAGVIEHDGSVSSAFRSNCSASAAGAKFGSLYEDAGSLFDENDNGNTAFFKTFLVVGSQRSDEMIAKDTQDANIDSKILASVQSSIRLNDSRETIEKFTTVKNISPLRKSDETILDENTSIFKPFIAIKPNTKNTQVPFTPMNQNLPTVQAGEHAIPSHSPPVGDVAPNGLNTCPTVAAAKTSSTETKNSLFHRSSVEPIHSPKANLHQIEATTVTKTSDFIPKSPQNCPIYPCTSQPKPLASHLDTKTSILLSTNERMDIQQTSTDDSQSSNICMSPTAGHINYQNKLHVHENATYEKSATVSKCMSIPDKNKADINPTSTQTLPMAEQVSHCGTNASTPIVKDPESLVTEDNPLKMLKSGVTVDENTAKRVKQFLFDQIAALQKKQQVEKKSEMDTSSNKKEVDISKDLSASKDLAEGNPVRETKDLSAHTCKRKKSENKSRKQCDATKLSKKSVVSSTNSSLQNSQTFMKSKNQNSRCKDHKLERLASRHSSYHHQIQTSSLPTLCSNENPANKQSLKPVNNPFSAQEKHSSLQVLEQLNSENSVQDSAEKVLEETEQNPINELSVAQIKNEPIETLLSVDSNSESLTQITTYMIQEKSKHEQSIRHSRNVMPGPGSKKHLEPNQQQVKVPEISDPNQDKKRSLVPHRVESTDSVQSAKKDAKPMFKTPHDRTIDRTESHQDRQQLDLPQHVVHQGKGSCLKDSISAISVKHISREGKETKDDHNILNIESPFQKECKGQRFVLPKAGPIDTKMSVNSESEPNTDKMESDSPNLIHNHEEGCQDFSKTASNLNEKVCDQTGSKITNGGKEQNDDLSRNRTTLNTKPVTRMTRQECKSAIIQTLHELSDVLQILTSNSNATKETESRNNRISTNTPISGEAHKKSCTIASNVVGESECSENHTTIVNDTNLRETNSLNTFIKTEPKDSLLLSESKQEDCLGEKIVQQKPSEIRVSHNPSDKSLESVQLKKESHETPAGLAEEQNLPEQSHLIVGNDKTVTVPFVKNVPTAARLVTCVPLDKQTTDETEFPVVFDVAEGQDLNELEKFGLPITRTYFSKRHTAVETDIETDMPPITKQVEHTSFTENNTENMPVWQPSIYNLPDTRIVNICSEKDFSGGIPQYKERVTVCIKQSEVATDLHVDRNGPVTSECRATRSDETNTGNDSAATVAINSQNEFDIVRDNGERNTENSDHLTESQRKTSYGMGNDDDTTIRHTNNSKSVESSQHTQIIPSQSSDGNRPKSPENIVFSFQEIKQMKSTQFRKFKMGLSHKKFIDFDEERHKKQSKNINSTNKSQGDFFTTDDGHESSVSNNSIEMNSVKDEVIDCTEGGNGKNCETRCNNKKSRPNSEVQIEKTRSKARSTDARVGQKKIEKSRHSRDKQKSKEGKRIHRRVHTNKPLEAISEDPKQSRTSFKKSGTGYFRWQNKYQSNPSKYMPDGPFVITKNNIQTKEEFEQWTRFKERENIRKNIETALREYRKTFEDTACDDKGDEKVSTYLKSLTERLDFLQSKRNRTKQLDNATNSANEGDVCSGIVKPTNTRAFRQELFSDQSSSKQLHRDNTVNLSSTVRQRHRENMSTDHSTRTESTDNIITVPNDIESSLTATMETLIKETIAKKFAHLTDKLKNEICNELVDGNQKTSLSTYVHTQDVNQTSARSMLKPDYYQTSHRERKYDDFDQYKKSHSKDRTKLVSTGGRPSFIAKERCEQQSEDSKNCSRSRERQRERPREFDTVKERGSRSRSRSRDTSLSYQQRGGSSDRGCVSLESHESISPKRDTMPIWGHRYRTRSPERTSSCFETNKRRSPCSSTSSFGGHSQGERSRSRECDIEKYESRGYGVKSVEEYRQRRSSKERNDNYRFHYQNIPQNKDTRSKEWTHRRDYSDFPTNDQKHGRRSEELQYCKQPRRNSDWGYETDSCNRSNDYERREINISNESSLRFDQSYNSDDSQEDLLLDHYEQPPRVNSQNNKRCRTRGIYSSNGDFLEDDNKVIYIEGDRNDCHFAHSKRPLRSDHFHKAAAVVRPARFFPSTFSRRQKRKYGLNSAKKAGTMFQTNHLEDIRGESCSQRGTPRITKRGRPFDRSRGTSRGKQRGKRRGGQIGHFGSWKSRKGYTGMPYFDCSQVKSEPGMSDNNYEGDNAVEISTTGYDAYKYRHKSAVTSPGVTVDRTHTFKTTYEENPSAVKSWEHARPVSVKSKPETSESTITDTAMPIPTISCRFRGSSHRRGSRKAPYHNNY